MGAFAYRRRIVAQHRHAAGRSDTPVSSASRAAVTAELRRALDRSDDLLGDRYPAADMLVASPYLWFPDFTPDDGVTNAWLERCA
ncbi:hypothetical protein DT23_11695 [Thioclava indica]|uniref:GST C-terminal domain-containing protein n=1 Tax=Thioclava indica TaxID=1353528 RepID=A0A074JT56_9RHOB|nr:hypothetical protein DT23_11695 [Thioclava indica]